MLKIHRSGTTNIDRLKAVYETALSRHKLLLKHVKDRKQWVEKRYITEYSFREESKVFSGIIYGAESQMSDHIKNSDLTPEIHPFTGQTYYNNCAFDNRTFLVLVEKVYFFRCSFNACQFAAAILDDVKFEECVFAQNAFDHYTVFKRALIERASGLHTNTNLHTVRVEKQTQVELDSDLREAPLPFLERWASWERLRTFGRLPLLECPSRP